jgi:hypothetical protein
VVDRASRPVPWQGARLAFAQGRRVTVAAAPGQERRLRQVVAVADRAAAVTDRYSTLLGNPQRRYRVYLAGDREWKAWFGGPPRDDAIGYAASTGLVGTEVVLKASALRGDRQMFDVVRHEFGHVVTLSGVDRRADTVVNIHEWLVEGIAEYVAHAPQPAAATTSRYALQGTGTPPTSVRVPPLTDDSTIEQVRRLYSIGHFAASCLAARFGEAELFAFVKRVLRDDASVDQASRAVFGRPFDDVDRDCVAEIRRAVG